jgi:hypothetical protein
VLLLPLRSSNETQNRGRPHSWKQSTSQLQRWANVLIHYCREDVEFYIVNRFVFGYTDIVNNPENITTGNQILG